QITGRAQRGDQPKIRVSVFCTPTDGFWTQHPRNPHLRMGFLIRQRPGVYMAIVEMLAFVAPRPWSSPGLDDEVVRFVEVLPVIGRVGVVEKLLAASAPYPSSHQASTRDQVDLCQFLGHAQRVPEAWQWITDQHDLALLG